MVFNVCVLLELSDSVYAGVITACVVCVHAKMCVVQWNRDSLPKLSVCSELAFAAETESSAAN